MSGVRLSGVCKSYGGTAVVDRLSLAVEPGEFLVLLGPSGCGKSTLLRMIAGLETIDQGEIHIGERLVNHLPPGQRRVAMVFQHYALYPHMSVRENLAFGLRNARIAEDEIARRVQAAAESLEIEALLDRRPDKLSGGQRQRVAIARAIVKEPELFLLDEPLSNLDAGLRVRTRLELARLHRRLGTTMIFVTHDQVEAMTLADRIVVLNEGGVEQVGSPLEIYRRPRTRFVATFVGSPRINLLPVTMAPADGAVARVRLRDGTELVTAILAATLPDEPEMTMGIRAERVRPAAEGKAMTTGKVELVERLGERTLLHVLLADGSPLVAEDDGMSSVGIGDSVPLAIDASHVHLFDADGIAYHAAERG